MSYTLRNQFSTALATTFLNDIQYQRKNYYYFLGKLEPWAADDRPPATVQELSETEDVSIRNNAAYFKKITPNDVSLVCSRYDWTSGTVYQQWDDTKYMRDSQFYVLTDENRVYKCLDNNSNSVSTVKPTTRNLQAFKTADGYTWKYMYTIPSFKRSRFMSLTQMPVQRAMSESFYSQGSIESISVVDSGSGYADTQQTRIVVTGATTGAGAAATFTTDVSGSITSITLTAGGSGYASGVRATIASGTGQDAVLRANVVAGVVVSVDIINPGVGYSSAVDTVEFSVGGANLIPVISRSTGSIVDVLIVDPGYGYTATPTLTLNTTVPAPDIDGLYSGNSSALLEAVVDDGSIKRVLIRDPGVNYPSDTSTTITISGDGVNLAVSPVIVNGEIVDVVVENPGYGYTFVNLSVIGDGTGANLRAILGNSDTSFDQSIVEQLAVDGAIYSAVITNRGSGYTSTTTVTIDGDGTGASAHCEVFNGEIIRVVMDTWGSGYTNATISFNDVNRNNQYNAYIDAEAYVILPPMFGHGFDAVNELFGDTVIVSSTIRSDTLITQYQQDYRQFGILTQPRNLISNKLSSMDFDFNVYKTTFTNTTSLSVDEVLVNATGQRYRVVYFSNNEVYLQPLQRTLIQPSGTLYVETNINRTYFVELVSAKPVINKYSGNLLYTSNEQPFEFSDTQSLLVKTYLKF